jgi:hypothetical protein
MIAATALKTMASRSPSMEKSEFHKNLLICSKVDKGGKHTDIHTHKQDGDLIRLYFPFRKKSRLINNY